ncbi:hypothetical protein RYX36_014748 [Vicia faba]
MLVKARKWAKSCQQSLSFNTQIVKEFYANLVDTNNKMVEVVVRGVKVSYTEETINMHFQLKRIKDKYQELMDASNVNDFDVYMESLCNFGTKWVESGGEKTIKRMDLHPEMKDKNDKLDGEGDDSEDDSKEENDNKKDLAKEDMVI